MWRQRAAPDVVRSYDALRARVGPDVPICVMGASAGGALALLLSVDRPSLACVMSWAGPTDLTTVATPSNPFYGVLQRLATSIHHKLAAWSAVSLAASGPWARVPPLRRGRPGGAVVAGGGTPSAAAAFDVHRVGARDLRVVHSGVDGTAFNHALTVEDRMLRSVAAQTR